MIERAMIMADDGQGPLQRKKRCRGRGSHSMMVRCMRLVGRLVVGHPGLVVSPEPGRYFVVVCEHPQPANRYRPGRFVWDRDPQWRAASQIGKELGYGNQLFVVIEASAIQASTIQCSGDQCSGGRNGRDRPDGRNGGPSHRRHASQRTVRGCAQRLAGSRNCST